MLIKFVFINFLFAKEAPFVQEIEEKAIQGVAEAQFNLGIMYCYSLGVKQNMQIAKKIFEQSCDGGFQKGCENYKVLNEKGF